MAFYGNLRTNCASGRSKRKLEFRHEQSLACMKAALRPLVIAATCVRLCCACKQTTNLEFIQACSCRAECPCTVEGSLCKYCFLPSWTRGVSCGGSGATRVDSPNLFLQLGSAKKTACRDAGRPSHRVDDGVGVDDVEHVVRRPEVGRSEGRGPPHRVRGPHSGRPGRGGGLRN